MDDTDATRPLGDATADRDRPVPTGTVLGRYVLLEDLGAGGEGRVYLAYDPVLERKVAVKVLRSTSTAYAALLREARVLAKIDHPHVVAIHDVVDEGDQPFMAMELMQGESFLQFAERASATELLLALIDVADAIAAAHEAGLVHGDVKPSNILRSKSGQTKLSDFGLARAWSGEASGATGQLVGTPAYVAPEQLAGGLPSPLTDQYAFCLTAWVAFHGGLPWTSDSTDASIPAAEGPTNAEFASLDRDAFPTRTVPRWTARSVPTAISRAFIRGLQLDPAERWPDMRSLLAVLRTAPRRRRILQSTLGFAAVSAATIAAVATNRTEEPCARAAAPIEDAWTEATRSAVRDAILTQDAYAPAHAGVESKLDAFAEQWSTMSRDSCEATRVHQTQSDSLLDLRRACLGDALSAFSATVQVLGEIDDDEARGRAHRLAAALPSLAPCGDLERLQRRVPLPDDPEAVALIDSATGALARVRALRNAGRYDEARTLWEQWQEPIEQLDHAPLSITLLDEQSRLANEASDYDVADQAARKALEQGLNIGDLDAALRQATTLTVLNTARQGNVELASRYREIARGLAERDGVEASDYAGFLRASGNVAMLTGNHEEAIALLQRAVDHYRRSGGDAENLARLVNDFSVALEEAGQLERAIEAIDETIALRRGALGPNHPEIARALHNKSQSYLRAERFEDAERASREALAILRDVFAPDHADVAYAEFGLANFLLSQARYEEAAALYEQALPKLEKRLGSTHPHVDYCRSSLGGTLVHLDRADEGLALLRLAVDNGRQTLGPDSPQLVDLYANYGTTLMEVEHFDEAARALEDAVELGDRLLGPVHMTQVRAVHRLAEVYRRQQRWTEVLELVEPVLEALEGTPDVIPMQPVRLRDVAAVAAMELGEQPRALAWLRTNLEAFRSQSATDTYFQAMTELRLAKLLWESPRPADRREAVEMGRAARGDFEAAADPDMVARAQTWLDEHRG